MANRSAHYGSEGVGHRRVVLVQLGDSLSGEGLGEADGVAAGLADVGVVQEPVNGDRGQGFGHELVEACRVQVRADRDGALFVSCVHDPVESFGRVGGHREQADVIDHHELGPQDPGYGAGDAVVGAVGADQGAEIFEPEPCHTHTGFDGLLAEGFEEERFPGAGRSADDQVFPAGDPFQGAQGLLGRARDGRDGGVPGLEGFFRSGSLLLCVGWRAWTGSGPLLPRRRVP